MLPSLHDDFLVSYEVNCEARQIGAGLTTGNPLVTAGMLPHLIALQVYKKRALSNLQDATENCARRANR